MGWQIVQNPKTKNYQVFSSIVDAFILDREVNREELTQFWKDEFGKSGELNFNFIMDKVDAGKPAYYQFTMTWDEAMMWHVHQTEHSTMRPDVCKICSEYLDNEQSAEAYDE